MHSTAPHAVAFADKAFLIFCSVGLIPIALSYGAHPSGTLTPLFGIAVESHNLVHILRAVMGLYLGMVVLWILGATTPRFTFAALLACATFMLGLATGRVLSLVLEGMPHFLLLVYLVLEVILGLIAIRLALRH